MTPTQLYQLRALARGIIPSSTLLKWDQRPLRGLWIRGLMRLRSNLDGEITSLGWEVYRLTTIAKYRKDASRPMFKRGYVRRSQSA